MFSDFPNLHPLVVHVPIVLILLGAASQAVLVFKDWEQVRWGTLLILAGGFAGALAASTTFHAMPTGLAPRAAAVFAAHEKFAGYTLWLSGITLLLRGIGQFFKIQRRAYEILVLGFALAAAGVLSVAGHRGAQLVYVEGVGPQGHLVSKHHGHEDDEEGAMPGMEMETGGQPAKAEADDHTENPAPGHQPPAEKPSSADMAGMDMSSPQPARPVAKSEKMADMPGMQMSAPKTSSKMPPGMKMNHSASPNQREEMPGMASMPGMKSQPAGAKKPGKAQAGMEGMADMPGMKMPVAQPAPAPGNMADMPGMEKGQVMPATGSMPRMQMPNPLDKFRFKDNNPARNQPSPKH
ncbi:hypothetical protein MUN82_21930 (plasmid) [Hymenobacter aerilatus]|uniref:DUF2231 domain-containing protein n=1 Tax=Hymenobacter aerilatus TaxID=2932251 RepID=A0A8T9T792_9BACT|nr:DUF2231 domain-containing protein [Hymenobacter aerilatus]UOR07699.1 hypothetical protein MUN82_21930 [Hymenobacter aerilatus]